MIRRFHSRNNSPISSFISFVLGNNNAEEEHQATLPSQKKGSKQSSEAFEKGKIVLFPVLTMTIFGFSS